MAYLYLKSIHVVFIVSWFAGLFYMPRLFIYHTEAAEKSEPDSSILKKQFGIMEKRLWQIITTPAMVLTLLSGIAMVSLVPSLLAQTWLQVKLSFVLLLLAYHIRTYYLYVALNNNVFRWSSQRLRLWNEVATLLLVGIVFLVVLKNAFSWIYGVVGLVLLGVILMIAVRLYKRSRLKL